MVLHDGIMPTRISDGILVYVPFPCSLRRTSVFEDFTSMDVIERDWPTVSFSDIFPLLRKTRLNKRWNFFDVQNRILVSPYIAVRIVEFSITYTSNNAMVDTSIAFSR